MQHDQTTAPADEPIQDTQPVLDAVDSATPDGTQAASPSSSGSADQVPDLAGALRAAEQLAQEHHDAWLRAKAETENVRRRAQEDIVKAHKFSVEKFAGELLAVKDSLEAAMNDKDSTIEILRSGVELTHKQLAAAFDKGGLSEVSPEAGEKFDPHRHQAMGMVDSEQDANTVVHVMQKGYLIADRVLRPALVMVAKPKN